MYCSKCGNKLQEGNKFCPNCGNQINSQSEKVDTDKVVTDNKVAVEKVNTVENKVTNKKSIDINKILIVSIIFFVLLIFSFIGTAIVNKNKSRVVMIYMVGSNLESRAGLATRDLDDLNYQELKKNNTKVILIAGGTTSWKNSYIDVNESSIYSLEETGFVKIDARPKTNMGSVDNLSYFLNYVKSNYKASKYNFIYWDHGGAVDGSEYDDFTDDNLKLLEMRDAFEKSGFKGRNKLETLSFRTCLNSTLEVANIYKDYAKYLVASEEVTIGSQADSAIRFLNEVKIDDTPVEFGTKQINVYKELVSNTCNYSSFISKDENYCIDSTYSITDLSKVDEIIKNLSSFSNDLNKNLSSNYNEYSKLRSNMKQYAEEDKAYDMIDLYNLTEKFDKYSTNGKKLRDSIEKAVVYNWTNTDFSHGLSIYFPYNNNVFLSTYNDISTTNDYTKLITNFYNMKSGMKISSYSNFSNATTKISDNKKENIEADVELELTEDQIKNMTKAGYLIFADTKDGYYQIVYSGKDVKVDGNKLKIAIKDRLLRLSDKEYSDENIWLLAQEEDIGKDYIDLKTYIFLSDTTDMIFGKIEPATATIRIDKEHKNGYVKAVYTDSENTSQENLSLFAPTGIKLTDYNFVTVMSSRYKLLDENGKYNPDWDKTSNHTIEGKMFRTNMTKFIKEDFSSGYDYYVVFRIFDVANNEYDSNPIKISK